MLPLTRRKFTDPRREGWNVYYGDVCVGSIARRTGVPVDVDQWGWSCGFYPGNDPGQQKSGSAASFESGRAAFEKAWAEMLPSLSEANFEEWREHRDLTAWKYQMRDRGCRLPTEFPEGRSRCFCGVEIDNAGLSQHVKDAHRLERQQVP